MTFIGEQWLLVSLLAVLAAALTFVESKKGGAALSHHELTRLLNGDQAVLVDVRDAKEFKAGHIVGAINIPFAKLAERSVELEKQRSKIVVVVDKMGQHAGAAGKTLREKGFNVSRLQGGMQEWSGQNLPVAKG